MTNKELFVIPAQRRGPKEDSEGVTRTAYMGEAVLGEVHFAPLNAHADTTAWAGSLATRLWGQVNAPATL